MKKKFKPDNQIRFYARPGWYILFISDICLAIWAAHGCATEGLWLEAVIGAFFILLGVWGLWQGYREFWELFWDLLRSVKRRSFGAVLCVRPM